MAERNRAAEFAAMQAADALKRADKEFLKGGRGRRVVDGRWELGAAASEMENTENRSPESDIQRSPSEEAADRRKENNYNKWIEESNEAIRQWTGDYQRIRSEGLLDNAGKARDGLDPQFVDRVMEELDQLPAVPSLRGNESSTEVLARDARARAKELLAAARVLDRMQQTVTKNVNRWKQEGLSLADDAVEWRKQA